jgi:hypothetical protein
MFVLVPERERDLKPHIRHQNEVSVVSSQETTLIRCISDVVRSGHRYDFVASKEQGRGDGFTV